MRKSLLALALSVAFPAAFAQMATNGVELYGVVDIGYENIDNGAVSVNRISSGISTGSRWGLRGREDLGGGYAALFTLESRVELDTGRTSNNGAIYWCGTTKVGTATVPSCPGVVLTSPLPPAVAPSVLAGNNTANELMLQLVTTVNGVNAIFDRQAWAGLVTPFGALIAGRQPPGKGEDPAGGDAERLGGRKIFRGGPHGQPQPGFLHQEEQAQTADEPDGQGPEAEFADDHVPEYLPGLGVGERKGEGLRFGAPEMGHQSLDDQAQTHGEDDLPEQGGIAPLGRDQDDKIEDHGQDRADQQGQGEGQSARKTAAQQGKGEKGAGRGHVPVPEIQDARGAINKDQPQGHQGIKGPDG
jgi:hypothetical protein